MKNIKHTCLVIPLLAALALLAGTLYLAQTAAARPTGQTYYVDQSHPLASDSNEGSAAAPWLTVQHAADVAAAGDTVYVLPGFYPERIKPQNSGAPGMPLTFKAEPRRLATTYGFYTVNSDYLRIEGFNITTDDSLTGWTDGPGVFIHSDHVEVVDNYFYNLESTAIQGYWHDPFPQGALILNNRIYHSQMGIGITGFNWRVEGNEVERLYMYGGGDCDYTRFFGEGHLLRGNFFHGTDFAEIGSAHVDCFQTFDNNGEYVHDIVIENNTCMDFHQGFMGEAAYYGNSSGLLFQNNVFAHGGAWGMSIHQIREVTAIHNVFADIRYHGIGLRDGATGVVQNNIFYNAGSNYWASDGGSVSGDHNLLYIDGNTIDPADFPADLVNLDPRFVNATQDDYHLLAGSPAVDAGTSTTLRYDIDGDARPQGNGLDIGADELLPALILGGTPGDGWITLNWSLSQGLPVSATWEIRYSGIPGDQPSPITGLPADTRAYTLTGLTNATMYSITLDAILDQTILLSGHLQLMPNAHSIYLPYVTH
jgi:hypothetical protein